jgi:hypothetical protein
MIEVYDNRNRVEISNPGEPTLVGTYLLRRAFAISSLRRRGTRVGRKIVAAGPGGARTSLNPWR